MAAFDYIVVQVPEAMMKPPRYWDPRLTWHLAELSEASSVKPIDWALTREPIDALAKDMIMGIEEPNEVHLWCPSWKALDRAWVLHDRLSSSWKKAAIRFYGLPKMKDDVGYAKWVGERSYSKICKLEPAWWGFLHKAYWDNSPLPFSRDTLQWIQRGVATFRFPSGVMKPKDVAWNLLKLKHVWWYDSLDWLDDFTVDAIWTRKVFDEIEDYDMNFEFTGLGQKERISSPYLQLLREAGMRVIDFGRIPVSWWNLADSPDVGRLQAAVIACRQEGVFATMTFMLDKGTTLESARRACEFSLEADLPNRPEVDVIPEEHTSEELREIAGGKWFNPTELTDLQLLGVQGAFETARPERIKP